MTQLANKTESLRVAPLAVNRLDDFFSLDTGFWTAVTEAGASVAVDSAILSGAVELTTAATDNIASTIHSVEIVDLNDQKTIELTGRINFAEAATNAANVAFGLAALTSTPMQDDGAGVKTSAPSITLNKRDGETFWRASAVDADGLQEKKLDVSAGGWQALRVVLRPISSTITEASFFIDPVGGNALVNAREANVTPRVPDLKFRLNTTGLAPLRAIFGVKAGSGTAEAAIIDYTTISTVR